MYKLENTRVTAQGLLDGEFENFTHDPIGYIKAMGWAVKPNIKKFLTAEAKNILFTTDDVDALERIVIDVQVVAEDALDVVENGYIGDFLTNCVAGHIAEVFDVKKDKPKIKKA